MKQTEWLPPCFNDLSYHAGTRLCTNKQKAVRLVYQLNSSDRCVYNSQTPPATDDFNIHTWPLLKTSVMPDGNACRTLQMAPTHF